MMKIKSFDSFWVQLSLIISDFLGLIPIKTRYDNTVVKIRHEKRYRYYISNPRIGIDFELGFPYFCIDYEAWATYLKKRTPYNRSGIIHWKDIVK